MAKNIDKILAEKSKTKAGAAAVRRDLEEENARISKAIAEKQKKAKK